MTSADWRLDQLFELLPDAVIVVDSEGRIACVNAVTELMFGYPLTNLLGQPIERLIPEQFTAASPQHLIDPAQVPRKRVMGAGLDLQGRRRDGSQFPMDLAYGPLELDAAPYTLMLVRDITERSRVEALQASEARLKLAQGVARIGTFDWDIRTGVNTWTPELEAMYGLPPGGFAGTQEAWERLVHPDDFPQAQQRVEQTLTTGEPVEGEWRVIWPDGSIHWLLGRWQAFRDRSGALSRMIGINLDITERKRAAMVLRERDELSKLNDVLMEREARVLELKHEVNELLQQQGLPSKYSR